MARAAKYRHVGVLLYKNSTSDCGMPESGEWLTFAEGVRAEVIERAGSQRDVPGFPLESDLVQVDICIHYRPGVTNRMRYRQERNLAGVKTFVNYDIQAVIYREADRELLLKCVRSDEVAA